MALPILVIAGPTAAGKSALAIEVALALGGEIVSADSRQVYRGLDIGTAKASAAEQGRVPHHLLDVADPTTPFDAARFVELARAAIADIAARGRVPLVVGGTGFYLRALCGGLAPAPGRDEALRRQLECERQEHGNGWLHGRLARVDPVAAAALRENDVVRIVRALEVFALTGRPLSAHQEAHRFADRPYVARWLVVDQPTPVLHARILRRAQTMFETGLVEEAQALRAHHGDIPLLTTLGYAEALAVAAGTLAQADAVARTAQRTRQYAKRQRTWLRREPVDQWLMAPDVAALLASAR